MVQVIVGGVLAVIGGIIGSIMNARFQKQYLEIQESHKRHQHLVENRNHCYHELIACLAQFLQFLHPSVSDDFKGKYSAGVSLVDYIANLARIQAGIQLYGSIDASKKMVEFFSYYNSIISGRTIDPIPADKYDELSRIANELFAILRGELQQGEGIKRKRN